MRLVTWAMPPSPFLGRSRWRSDVARLFQSGAEIVCLQTCGEPPATAVPGTPPPWLAGHAPAMGSIAWQFVLWNVGTKRQPHHIHIVWLGTDSAGGRANLAIAYSSAAIEVFGLIYLAPGLPGKRPALGVRVSYGGAPFDIYSVHTIAPGGPDGPGLLRHILCTRSAHWFAAGIYYAPPDWWTDVLPPLAVVCPHNGALGHLGDATHLDYALKSAIGGATIGTVFAGFVVADHAPIAYLL